MIIIRCISVKLVVGLFLVFRCSTANWWERSPNYNNSNNFCNVNTNGNANNNNARNANGLAPDFVSQQWFGSIIVTPYRVKYDPYERRNASCDESPKLPSDILARTPPGNRACMAGDVSYPVSCAEIKQVIRYSIRHLYGGRINSYE